MPTTQEIYMSAENQRKIREAQARAKMTPAEERMHDKLKALQEEKPDGSVGSSWAALTIAAEKLKAIRQKKK